MNLARLHEIAAIHNIIVVDDPKVYKAAYAPDSRTIHISPRLSPTAYLCSFAHELGHAINRHEHGNATWKEREADNWAANQLISLTEYRILEQIYDTNEYAIAEELGVTMHILRVWKTGVAQRAAYLNYR